MALVTKESFLNIDKTGTRIFIQEDTGAFNVSTNPEGWGFPNTEIGDINKIIYVLTQYSSNQTARQTYVRVADPLHPEYLLTPTINQITSGTTVEINSMLLGISPVPLPFDDGVFDLNVYHVLTVPKTGVIIATGNTMITGTGLSTYVQYDSVLVGDRLYDIDKSKPNSDTVLFLVQEIQEPATSFNPTYRANVKFINTLDTEVCVNNKAGKLASDCGCDDSDKAFKLYTIKGFQWAANKLLQDNNMVEANKLIRTANKLCKSLNCGC